MRTEQLITVMAADERRDRPVPVALPLALAAAATAAAALFYGTMGIRPDLSEALAQVRVLAKQGFPIVLAVASFGAVLRLARPGEVLGGWSLALLVAPVIVLVAFVITAASLPMSAWPAEIIGHSIAVCLTCIPLIGAPILAASLWALRRGASTRPVLSGAMAGLMSGAVSASVYAFYCTDDSPMFWGLWYLMGIGILTALGAWFGRRWLIW